MLSSEVSDGSREATPVCWEMSNKKQSSKQMMDFLSGFPHSHFPRKACSVNIHSMPWVSIIMCKTRKYIMWKVYQIQISQLHKSLEEVIWLPAFSCKGWKRNKRRKRQRDRDWHGKWVCSVLYVLYSFYCNQVAESTWHQMPIWESRVGSVNNSNLNSVSADFFQ